MMFRSVIDRQIIRSWNRHATQIGLASPYRIDLHEALGAAESRATRTVRLLQPWLRIYDEAFHGLLRLNAFVTGMHRKSGSTDVFWLLTSRVCSLVASIRELLLKGLEQPASILARSLLETFEFALVCLNDDEFAARFSADDVDPDNFWRAHVARGKLSRAADHVAHKAGISDDLRRNSRKYRQHAMRSLSRSVHPSAMSVFFGAAVPSLAQPGSLIVTPLGHHSDRSPILLDAMAKETLFFLAVVIKLYMRVDPPRLFAFRRSASDPVQAHLFVDFLTLQEIVTKHDADIASLPELIPRPQPA